MKNTKGINAANRSLHCRVRRLAVAFERRAKAYEKTYRNDPHAKSSDQVCIAIGCWTQAAKALRAEIDKSPNAQDQVLAESERRKH